MLSGWASIADTPALSASDLAIIDTLVASYEKSGSSEDILFWTPEQRRVGFKEMDNIYPTRMVPAGDKTYQLTSSPTDFSDITYTVNGTTKRVADFLDKPESIGLIVVHKDKILSEYYADGNNKESRWISFSVSKSITSLLIGAAIQDGYIESVDEPVVNYLPRLRGTAYEHATIKNVLNMASGVEWNENYSDPESDVAQAGGLNGLPLIQYLAKLPVGSEPGEVFNYSTGETNLAGGILRAAIGNNASTYLTHKIWQPFGMEFDASWVLDGYGGAELGGCCLNASLRDYARLGIFAMHNGQLADGTQVIPENWMKESTTPSKGLARYGYFWWLNGDGSYAARGIFGQTIMIDPEKELVIAMHNSSASVADQSFGQEMNAVVMAIAAAIK
ncbi:MAG: serine hydrolase [SAR86 cluster bacterium]|uniref:Serine hydrolase n=1 Tax=SAR86 cluster bacterium TaxID=2030880 RepID=A0A2A5B115_9GAMM|nr:MAG: serine hydrolase [SAR86 cluster bacterium]